MLKIAVGTTSQQKLDFLNEILDELNVVAKIIPCDVPSGVAEQPITSDETKKGSINRATNALKESAGANISLGIEVGYQLNDQDKYEMLCWVTIADSKQACISVSSHSLELPEFHQEVLRSNQYLGDYVRQFLETSTDPISQHIGIIIRDRKPFIQTALKSALLQYFIKYKK